MTDNQIIEGVKNLILKKLDAKGECELTHNESNSLFFIKTYDEGLTYYLYSGSDLIIGDADLFDIASTLCNFHIKNNNRKNNNIDKPLDIKTKDDIKNLLMTNDKFLCKSLMWMYSRQTEDEQVTRETNVKNNVGFNSVDAKILSSMAKGFEKYHKLTNKQLDLVRSKMLKYSGQIFNFFLEMS